MQDRMDGTKTKLREEEGPVYILHEIWLTTARGINLSGQNGAIVGIAMRDTD